MNILGTLVKSGTKTLMDATSAGGDIALFVGFWSAKNKDEEQYIWESAAVGSSTVQMEQEGPSRGQAPNVRRRNPIS